MKHPRFILELEALPRGNDSDGMRRLRAVLKLLLRGFGFKCKSIQYPPASSGDSMEAKS